MKQLTLIAFVCIACINVSVAQSGTLDLSFNDSGKVVLQGYGLCKVVLIQSDGKILTGGRSYLSGGGDDFQLIRFTPDGKFDPAFGNEGIATTNFNGYGDEIITSMALLADGKVLACGYGLTGPINDATTDILIGKYKTDGTLDNTFGNKGKLIINNGGNDIGNRILAQPDGKFIVVGTASYKFFASRYFANGTIDPSFGNAGVFIYSFGSIESVSCAALTAEGALLMGGIDHSYPFLIVKLSENGTIDSSFGINGKTYTDVGNYGDMLNDIVLQSDGKILAAGTTEAFDSSYFFMLRYDIKGNLDSTFGKFGMSITDFNVGYAKAYKVIIQNDGNIITIGSGFNESDYYGYFLSSKYNNKGILDQTYGNNGKTMLDLGYSAVYATGALAVDEKIILAGYSYSSYLDLPYSVMLARYNNDTTERNKYVRIKHWLHHHGITWEDKPNNLINYYSIQSSTNGNAFTEVARIFSKQNGGIQTYTAANNATANYRVAAISNKGNIMYSNTLTLTATPTIQLYPNPAKNNLQIQGLPAGTTKLTVTDISGNTRLIATVNSTVYSINIAQLTSGNYLLNIKTANEVITKQFIKE